ncbi:hypothetical protein HDE69_001694 [Pedobacter cryoconitis]|uniref:Uncharacterized protein n=1 Tax=Pedobacter cryoconitis TaxID=188932 RepID=A0A7W8YRW4_9SPHI|nr:hypothetical protein [Pedobacter cryoconitis]MBB5620645.1 hypothetical protein [Pedobacter cryoconitis]
MARAWYNYNGVGDPLVLGSYLLSTVKPACINGGKVCAIYELNGGATPQLLSSNIRNYIANLLSLSVAQPDSIPGIKKYVYGKAGC